MLLYHQYNYYFHETKSFVPICKVVIMVYLGAQTKGCTLMPGQLPSISVIMPLYNAADYLKETLHSILNQTFQDFELIIVDDASTDDSQAIVESFGDPRILLLRNDTNCGQVFSLNRALSIARANYVAQHDADDISFPTRFEKQWHYLQTHPEIAMVGAWSQFNILDTGSQYVRKVPTAPSGIDFALCLYNCFSGSNIMYRKSVAQSIGGHSRVNSQSDVNHDYYFYILMAACSPLAIIPEVLGQVNIHSDSYSQLYLSGRTEMLGATNVKINSIQLERLLGHKIPMPAAQFLSLYSFNSPSWEALKAGSKVYVALFQAIRRRYPDEPFYSLFYAMMMNLILILTTRFIKPHIPVRVYQSWKYSLAGLLKT